MSEQPISIANCELHSVFAEYEGRQITLAEMLSTSQFLAEQLPDAPYIVSLCKDRYLFSIGFCATLLKSSTNLLPPNKQLGTIKEIQLDYPDNVCITDHATDPELGAINITEIVNNAENRDISDIPLINAEQVAAIAFTSGSTGKPKPNVKKWRTLVGTTHKLHKRLIESFPSQATIVATVPTQHMYGLEMTLMMALHGKCVMESSQPFYPNEVASKLAKANQPRLLVTTPIHMRALVEAEIILPPIQKTISATAPLPLELAMEAEQRFKGVVEEIYGCTEAGSSATRRTIDGARWTLLDGMLLNVKDNAVHISGDHLDDEAILQDRLNVLSETEFEFLGRAGDLLNVGGKRASLTDLTQTIASIEGVQDAVVFIADDSVNSVTQRPAALVVSELSDQAIRKAATEKIDPVFIPRPIKKVPAIPRNENGKLQFMQIAELLNQTDG